MRSDLGFVKRLKHWNALEQPREVPLRQEGLMMYVYIIHSYTKICAIKIHALISLWEIGIENQK
jgi:hypothetical protein